MKRKTFLWVYFFEIYYEIFGSLETSNKKPLSHQTVLIAQWAYKATLKEKWSYPLLFAFFFSCRNRQKCIINEKRFLVITRFHLKQGCNTKANKALELRTMNSIYSIDATQTRSVQENVAFCVSLKNILKLRYKQLMRSKIPFCLCILLYLFICLFGNVVTGIFLYKHAIMNKQNETMKDILTTRLDSSDSSQVNVSNITSSFKENDPEDIEIADFTEIMNRLQLNKTIAEVSIWYLKQPMFYW